MRIAWCDVRKYRPVQDETIIVYHKHAKTMEVLKIFKRGKYYWATDNVGEYPYEDIACDDDEEYYYMPISDLVEGEGIEWFK